jgi:hypothetical protein
MVGGRFMDLNVERAIVLLSQMYLPQFDDEEKEALSTAIYTLEKRIPKKVKVEEFNRYNIYYCPICDGCIGDSLGHIGDGFCSSCGQRLDWSDTE